MRFRKPETIPLLFILTATILLVGLGVWQLKRLAWKEQLITQVEKMQGEAPMESLPGPKPLYAEFGSIRLRGTLLHDKEIHKTSKYHSNQVGYHILTPLQTFDHDESAHEPVTILVNRGWVPAAMKERSTRPQTVAQQNVVVSGLLVSPQKKNPFLPANDLGNNVWLYDDLAQMSEFTGEPLYPMILVQTGEQKAGQYPIPSDGKIRLRNDHLGYAITWFILAVVGLVMFGFYYRVPK